jgi:hypothetical protein
MTRIALSITAGATAVAFAVSTAPAYLAFANFFWRAVPLYYVPL